MCCDNVHCVMIQMVELFRPTTPLGEPDEGVGMLERMTRSGALRPEIGDSPKVKLEARRVTSATRRPDIRPSSVGSKPRQRPPTVEYPGYREMISRLQEETANDIRVRTRNVIEGQFLSPSFSTKDDGDEMESSSLPDNDKDDNL